MGKRQIIITHYNATDSAHLHLRILIPLALSPRGYLAEWCLLTEVDTSVANGQADVCRLRDEGLIEEMPELPCRWRLTPVGWQWVVQSAQALLERWACIQQECQPDGLPH